MQVFERICNFSSSDFTVPKITPDSHNFNEGYLRIFRDCGRVRYQDAFLSLRNNKSVDRLASRLFYPHAWRTLFQQLAASLHISTFIRFDFPVSMQLDMKPRGLVQRDDKFASTGMNLWGKLTEFWSFSALKKLAEQITIIEKNRARNLGTLLWETQHQISIISLLPLYVKPINHFLMATAMHAWILWREVRWTAPVMRDIERIVQATFAAFP